MIISEQIFEDNVDLISSDLNKDIDNIILIKLQKKYEGLCRDNSFILKNSINISKRSMGKIETYDNINYIKYVVSYKCDTISLKMGDMIECFVSNKNKMGIIAYVKIKEYNINNSEDSPLIIIIPLEYINESDSYDFN